MTKSDPALPILFTAHISDEIRLELLQNGVNVQVQPFIAAQYPDALQWKKQIPKEYDAWVFTSKRAVKAIAGVVHELSIPPYIFAVGEETARKLKELSLSAIIPDEFNLIALSEKMKEYSFEKGIHFCGNRKSGDLSQLLSDKHIKIQCIEVYQTILKQSEIDTAIYGGYVFMSPSAVEAFHEKNNIPKKIPVYSIGPSTTNALKKNEVENIIQAPHSTIKSLAITIQNNYLNVLT